MGVVGYTGNPVNRHNREIDQKCGNLPTRRQAGQLALETNRLK